MMTYLQIAAAVGAVAVAAGPSLATVWTKVLERVWEPPATPDAPQNRPIAPNYQTAMQNLASVRLRLLRTESLSKDASEAIEVLTLALMQGSDR
jgi:hypothetical protein